MEKPTEECCSGTSNQKIECSCCGGKVERNDSLYRKDVSWISGVVNTTTGDIPKAKTSLNSSDVWGTVKARWGIGRMRYTVPPGLYAVGNPSPESPVLVSANYKMSFDRLRKQLSGRDAWILVLDTKGINVWCAAGKGTFGTGELLRRIKITGLDKIVSHRKLIVPQLGATGVSGYKVQKASGFRVIFGPVRVEDLSAFLDSGMKAQPEMRRIQFGIRDRAVLIPVELVGGMKYILLLSVLFAIIGGLSSSGYSLSNVLTSGVTGAAVIFGAFLSGVIFGPILLPWLPGRAFALKGAVLGVALATIFIVLVMPILSGSWLHSAAFALMIPTLVSFTLMNFTGASTFTSLSGVLREMRIAVPVQTTMAIVGVVLWISGLFIKIGN
jgi:hypothetical protein